MTALSDLLERLNRDRLSARAVALRAQDLGYELTHDTANKYLKGRHGQPKEDTLRALAAVFDVEPAKLRRAAARSSGESEPYHPPAEANQLGPRERALLDELIRLLADQAATRELAGFASALISSQPLVADLWVSSGTKPDLVWRTESGELVDIEVKAAEDPGPTARQHRAARKGTKARSEKDAAHADAGQRSQDPGGLDPA